MSVGGDSAPAAADRFDCRVARRSTGLLAAFNEAGVVTAADVHVARVLGSLAAPDAGQPAVVGGEVVLLAAALAVGAPRLGHVCVDLATAAASVPVDPESVLDAEALPWPDLDGWLAEVAASPLVATGDGPQDRPLRLAGTRLYLDRYWREEQSIAGDLVDRSVPALASDALASARPGLAAGLARLFPAGEDEPDLQRLGAAVAVHGRLTVLAGGPGTGKTTAVARILALLTELATEAGSTPPRVALAAPTGKAAARLQEAIHREADTLDVSPAIRLQLLGLEASTLHRLLGWQPGSRSRFRHHRGNRLPQDVVVVDEASMVSLSLMAKLVAAVRSDARLILLGDPDQLASVEAGAVLGDIVGPAATGLRITAGAAASLATLTGQSVPTVAGGPAISNRGGGAMPGMPDRSAPAAERESCPSLGDSIVVLRRVHRFGGGIATLAAAIQRGDAGGVVDVLRAGGTDHDLRWLELDVAELAPRSVATALAPVRAAVESAAATVVESARAGDGARALAALDRCRLLCAHRRGPYGVATWTVHIEAWLAAAVDGYGGGGRWYPGRPLLVTENDHSLRLFNGDTGVVVASAGGAVRAAFERRGAVVEISPSRLDAVETMHAMTVHKSQGSQLDEVVMVLPDPGSPILTRELLYTAATRARSRLTVVATEASVRTAVERPVARASGLRELLWDSAYAAGA